MKIGMNLNWQGMYNLGAPYNDVMVMAGLGESGPWNMLGPSGEFIYTSIDSFPPVGSITNTNIGYSRPGTYTVTAQGSGTLLVELSPTGAISTNMKKIDRINYYAVFSGVHSYNFEISSQTSISLKVIDSNPALPLGNIKILSPGAGPGLYHPEYLDSLSPYDTFRFMDPLNTAGSTKKMWNDRNVRYGQDIESMIALCNKTQRNGWFNLPAMCAIANGSPTDFPFKFGELLNTQLDPNLTAYIEYSNEVWNWGFPFVVETAYAYFTQGSKDYKGVNFIQEVALLNHAIHNAVESRISDNGPTIKKVFAFQLANLWTLVDALEYGREHGFKFDCIAGAPYWEMLGDVNLIQQTWASGNQQLALQMIDDGFRAGAQQTLGWIKAAKAYADKYNVELITYEGGPSCSMWRNKNTYSIIDAYTHDDLCIQQHEDTLAMFADAGVDLFMYYSYCHPNPMWSSRKNPDDVLNRRYLGLLSYMNSGSVAIPISPDVTTSGNWIGNYGKSGAVIAGVRDVLLPSVNLPPIASISGGQFYSYAAPGTTDDPRALQLPSASGRVAAAWYTTGEMNIQVSHPRESGLYQLSLYCLNWPATAACKQTITLTDANTGVILNQKDMSVLKTPIYMKWITQGQVNVNITCNSVDALVSAVFIDPVQQ